MTTHELARILLEGPDLMVTHNGYEGGVNEIFLVVPPKPIILNANEKRSWVGLHEYFHGASDVSIEKAPETKAIHLC